MDGHFRAVLPRFWKGSRLTGLPHYREDHITRGSTHIDGESETDQIFQDFDWKNVETKERKVRGN